MPGGLIISTLAVRCYTANPARDDISLFATVKNIVQCLSISDMIHNPVDSQQLLTCKDKYTKQVKRFKKQLVQLMRRLEKLSEEGCTSDDAHAVWYWIFQHEFWQQKLAKSAINSVQATLPSVITSEYGSFCITADVAKKKGGPTHYRYRSGGPPIPKGMSIKFSVTVLRQIGENFSWEVRNFGDEAEEQDDLGHRSEHQESINWESTAYKGTHQMVCEFLRAGIAVDRCTFTVKIGER
jgi:hypothetical protein